MVSAVSPARPAANEQCVSLRTLIYIVGCVFWSGFDTDLQRCGGSWQPIGNCGSSSPWFTNELGLTSVTLIAAEKVASHVQYDPIG